MARPTADEYLMQRISRLMTKGIAEYGLIEDGDRILVGLSGGKDSLALLELLAHRSRILKPRFTLMAAHVSMQNIPYQADLDYLHHFAGDLGVELVTCQTSFDATTDTRKSPCFLCSWNRRKALFTLAHEHGCNKIALGHHNDDILATLLMNLTFQGAFATMPPRLVMRKFPLTVIRPLCLVPETDLRALATLRGYHSQVRNCPYEHDSHRSQMQDILQRLALMNPEARYSLWKAMSNIQQDLLPEKIS